MEIYLITFGKDTAPKGSGGLLGKGAEWTRMDPENMPIGAVEYLLPDGSRRCARIDLKDMWPHVATKQISERVLYVMDSLKEVTPLSNVVVNIGANDGVSLDPVYDLYTTRDCSGVCIDYEDHYTEKLKLVLPPNVDIIIEKVTPDNILDMISDYKDIDVVSIDIDSYDYFILEKIVTKKPKLILIEVNSEIPPGIFFARKYTEDYNPGKGKNCYGCSLEAVAQLAKKSGYKLLSMDWQTAFLIRDDISPHFSEWYSSVEDHYKDGYAEREGKSAIFYHQGAESEWWKLPVEEAFVKVKEAYKDDMDDILLELTE